MSNSNSGGGYCPLWIPIAVWLVLVVIAGIFSSWK